MKRFASTLAISLLTTLALPISAVAQLAYAQPNICEFVRWGPYEGEHVCSFHPTSGHGTLVVFSQTIHSRVPSFAYFEYMPVSLARRGATKLNARVNCNEATYWHWWRRSFDETAAKREPAESSAAQRMLGYVCKEAGYYATP